MSIKRGPKSSAPSAPDRTSDPEADTVQTAASLEEATTIRLDSQVAAVVSEGVDLSKDPRVKLEQELEEDLRQDLEVRQQKGQAQTRDAEKKQLRLAIYRDELFRAGLRKELESLIGFLKKKIDSLPGASSGLRLWSNLQAERTYLEGLLGVAEKQLSELGG